MLTDRISLSLAYQYLKGAENTYIDSNITSMLFSYSNVFTSISKTLTAGDMNDLSVKIEQVAPRMTVLMAECFEMGLYELRSFTLRLQDETEIYFEKGVNGWRSASSNASPMTIVDLTEYSNTHSQIKDLYLHVYDNEYIQNQKQYISCDYIQTLFGPIVDEITILYQKYKNL